MCAIQKLKKAGLALTAALALGQASNAQMLNIVSKTEVKGPEILLKELVRNSDTLPDKWHDRTVLPAPDPGVAEKYSLQAIAYALQQYPDMASVNLRGSGKTLVSTASSVLDSELVNKKIRLYIESHEKWEGSDFQVAYGNGGAGVLLPVGKQSVEIDGFEKDRKNADLLNFKVKVSIDGEYFDTVRIPIRILPVVNAWFATKPLARGDLISREDLELREVTIDGASRQYMTEEHDLSEFEVSRTIRAGDPVFRHMLVLPEYARRGDMITVTAAKGNVDISILATALAAGRKYDRIMCMNEKTKRRFIATLTGDREAEISFSDN